MGNIAINGDFWISVGVISIVVKKINSKIAVPYKWGDYYILSVKIIYEKQLGTLM